MPEAGNPPLPFAVVCLEISKLLDGWSAGTVATTCRTALEVCKPILQQQQDTKRELKDMMRYLERASILFPGFAPADLLDMEIYTLPAWEPPEHPQLCRHMVPFMGAHIGPEAAVRMSDWIHRRPFFNGLNALEVLDRMNPHHKIHAPFQQMSGILKRGHADFLYSPAMQDGRYPARPGLIIAFRYEEFPLALCVRYSDANTRFWRKATFHFTPKHKML